jgi:hypothetical protein
MLKFINLILEPINKNCVAYEMPDSKTHRKLTSFLLNFILRYVRWVPHNLNEEAFKVLDLLLYTVRFSLKYAHIQAVTLALLDKYTMRSKIHKETMSAFINLLLDHDNYAEMGEFPISRESYIGCFIDVIISDLSFVNRLPQNIHQENIDFLEKVDLLNTLISDMDEQHTVLFSSIIRNSSLHDFLCTMTQSGFASVSLKALQIVQNFTKYYIQCSIGKDTENDNEIQQSAEDEQEGYDIQTLSHTRLFLIQLIVKVTFISIDVFGNKNAYVEFST